MGMSSVTSPKKSGPSGPPFSNVVRKTPRTRFPTISLHFRPFSPFLAGIRKWRPSRATRSCDIEKSSCTCKLRRRIRPAAHQDLFRAMDPRRSRHFRASIHGPMAGMTRLKRGIAAPVRLGPAKTQGITPSAARTLRSRRKKKMMARGEGQWRVAHAEARRRGCRLPYMALRHSHSTGP